MKYYPGERQTIAEVLNAYRSIVKDFRGDITQARVFAKIASLASSLKPYVGRGANMPSDYIDFLSDLSMKISSILNDLESAGYHGDKYDNVMSANLIASNMNRSISKSLQQDVDPRAEEISHYVDSIYHNLRMALQ